MSMLISSVPVMARGKKEKEISLDYLKGYMGEPEERGEALGISEEELDYINNNAESGDGLVPDADDYNEEESDSTSGPKRAASSTKDFFLDPVNVPFNVVNFGDESVSLASGGLNYRKSLLTLPGRNGLSVDLAISYSSDSAVFNKSEYEVGAEKTMENFYNFASGWSFGFDTIILDKNKYGNKLGSTLVLSNGESYGVAGGSSSATDSSVTISDYKLSEMTMVKNKERYKLTFNNGITETFDADCGVILTREDRFGNKITFEYEEIEYFKGTFTDYFYSPASYLNTVKALSKITDSVGNEIDFSYDRERRWNGIYISKITISMDGEPYSEIKLGNRKNSYGDYSYVESVTEYLDSDGAMTTSFEYENNTTKIYNEDAGTYTLMGENLLLTKVSYPTGGSTVYTYEPEKRKYKYGNYDVYKVKRSENSGGTVTEYDYDGDYSLYPQNKYHRTIVTKYVDSELKKGQMTAYGFDNNHNLVSQTSTDITNGKNIYIGSRGTMFKTIAVGDDLYRFDLRAPYITAYKQTADGEYTMLKPYYIGQLSEFNYLEGVKKIGDEIFVFVDYYTGGGVAKYHVASYNITDDSWTDRKKFSNDYEKTHMTDIYYNGSVFYMPMRKGRYFYHMTYDPAEDSWFITRQGSTYYSEYGVSHIGVIGDKAYYFSYDDLVTYSFTDQKITTKTVGALKRDRARSGFVKNGEIIFACESGFRTYDPETNRLGDAVPYQTGNINGYSNGPGNTLYYLDPSEKRTLYSYDVTTHTLTFLGKRMFTDNSSYSIIQTNDAIYLNTGGNASGEMETECGGFEKISLSGGNAGYEIITNTYDSLKRITASTKTVYRGEDVLLNNTETWTYSGNTNSVASYTDLLGNKSSYTYDTAFMLPKTEKHYQGTDGAYTVTNTLSEDKAKILKSEAAYSDRTLIKEYEYADSEGETEYPGNVTMETLSVKKGTVTKEIRTLSYSYDGTHAFLAETSADNIETNNSAFEYAPSASVVTSAEYNIFGQKTKEIDPNGNITRYGYNKKGWNTSAVFPGGKRADVTYEIGENSKTTVSYNNGEYEEIAYYDGLGRAKTVKDSGTGKPERFLKEYVYDGPSLSAVRTVGGNYTLYSYDGYGREVEKLTYSNVDNRADKCYSVYDDIARSVKNTVRNVDLEDSSEETLRTDTSYYDSVGRLTEKTAGNNLGSRTYTYDYRSNLTSETDGNGNKVTYTYNNLGQLASVKDAEDNVTAYAYDLAGNLESVTSPGARAESYEYDTLGRLIKRTDKLGKSELYMYDASGNTLKKKDRLGNVTVNGYNSRNLLVSTETGGQSVSYAYDSFDNVTEMTDGTGTTEYSYTFDNLLASVTYPDGRSMSYSYLPEDNEVVKTDYSGEETVEKFTAGGVVSSVSNDDGALAGYGFKGGLLTSASFGNGSVTYSYDRAGRITALNNSVGTASRGYAYEYDRAGNQTKKTETGNGEDKVTEYAYDSLNRLSEVTEDDGTRTEYSFDAWGNITEKAYHHPSDYVFELGETAISGVTEHTVSYSYDEANRLLSETESVTGSGNFSGTRTYVYDDAGNFTSKTTSGDYGAKSESYVYDAFGKLIKYLENGEEKASYKYNGNGQRVEKTVNGVKTKFYWDGANIKNEGTASAVNATNYFGANGVFARKSGSVTNTLYKNGHGDTVLLTSGNTVVRDYDYDAYGKEKGGSSADENPFRYSGEYFDSETGFIYLRNRYYDPSSARFISEDPIRDGYNWYAYCEGNPITKIDPWGLGPRDHFSSADDAAADFGLYIGQTSIDIEEEFFSFIFMDIDEDGNEYFYYDTPRNDYETHEERSTGFYFREFDPNAIGIAHTHGSYDANNNNTKDGFSSPGNSLDANFSDTSESDRFGVNYYVVTPAGNLYRYDANSGNTDGTLVSTDMIVDARIQIHQQMKGTLLWGLLQSKYPKGTAQDYVNARLKNPDSLLGTINDLESYR